MINKKTEQSNLQEDPADKDRGNLSAIRAFRTYARLFLDRDSLPPHIKYSRIRGVCRTEAEAISMLAVCDTLRILRLTGKTAALRAVRKVWMTDCFRPLRKQDISMRVRQVSFSLFCDERTVYRYLRTATEMYREILKENTEYPRRNS